MSSDIQDITKHIRSGVTVGSIPTATEDYILLTEISYEAIYCGWLQNGTLEAFRTFPLFKVTDNEQLYALYQHILHNEIGITAYTNIKMASWQWPYTLVPQPYFTEDRIDDFLRFQYHNYRGGTTHYEEIAADTTIVYAYPPEWTSLTNTTIHHLYASVLQTLLATPEAAEPTVWAYIHAQEIGLFYIKNNKLILANSFQPRNQQDFLYYIMLVYNQLKLDATEVPLRIMGEVQTQSALNLALSKYIRFVQFAKHPDITYHADIAALPAHYYYGLYALASCALSAAH